MISEIFIKYMSSWWDIENSEICCLICDAIGNILWSFTATLIMQVFPMGILECQLEFEGEKDKNILRIKNTQNMCQLRPHWIMSAF